MELGLVIFPFQQMQILETQRIIDSTDSMTHLINSLNHHPSINDSLTHSTRSTTILAVSCLLHVLTVCAWRAFVWSSRVME
jgi:exosortase/archaeosortase